MDLSTNMDLSTETAYERAVHLRLQRLRQSQPDWTLKRVLPQMRGAPPELLLRLCPELASPALPDFGSEYLVQSQELEPHPLDYDWRFLPETITRLLKLIEQRTRVILMGAPSLLEPLSKVRASVLLLDRNPAVQHSVHVDFAHAHAYQPIPGGGPTSVLLDAPWYLEDLLDWINFAIKHVNQIDTLFFSLWPELIRPAAVEERSFILSWLERFGLVRIVPDFLTYQVPLFEKLAYLERGIALDFFWRKGDIVIFQPDRPMREFVVPTRADTQTWQRYLIGNRQIAVKHAPASAPLELHPIGNPPTWHFDTVSRRDPRRAQIHFWTSNNIVGQMSGNQELILALGDFFGTESQFDTLSIEQKGALNLLSDLNCVRLDNRQAYVTWQHQE